VRSAGGGNFPGETGSQEAVQVTRENGWTEGGRCQVVTLGNRNQDVLVVSFVGCAWKGKGCWSQGRLGRRKLRGPPE